MRRRSRPAKARRQKTAVQKRAAAGPDRETELARLRRELSGSLEQQTATSEVLRVISSSSGELEPVFQAILENAVRICKATFGNLYLHEGDGFRAVAMYNAPPGYAEKRGGILHPSPNSVIWKATQTKRPAQTADITKLQAYVEGDPWLVAGVALAGYRSALSVPMLHEGGAIGGINIFRQETGSFEDKQVELLANFAKQAVIAIENARLLNELRDSLDRQTATADVLRIISSSPGELDPVFQAILRNAVRICEAKFGHMLLADGDLFRLAAEADTPAELAEHFKQRGTFEPTPGSHLDRVRRTKQVSHTADDATESVQGRAARYGGARSIVTVPMLKDEVLIGVILIYRQEVRAFTEKQIELVKNFAAQAVIAIENTRLLSELRERTHELEVRSQEIAKLNAQLEQRVADQVGEIERMGRLRRFLPPQVADLIVASGAEKQLESHRRDITALFCDLRGFTGFSESSDAEDVMALLREYHAAIGEIVIKYSGTLERYAGDGVMVIFNDPVPVENPALQAVMMALDMRTAIGGMIEKWRDLGHDLGFGIGIANGFATLGTIGYEGRFDYAAIGTVSNVASRLCDEAKPGQILISPRVRQAVDEAVTVEPVGEFTLKGIRRPMMTYNVLESSPSKPN
jgi:class 3 adenylate cyclase/putative methionine-R-sulfoxide reductase with GAF domain